MKISVIVAVYKDIDALDLVVQSLKEQTYKNFELVVVEDAQNKEMKEYIESIEGLEVRHTFQEDRGVRKSRSQNNGILASTGEYLVFVDGDCILAPNFIESHAFLAEKDFALSGRRFNLNQKQTDQIRQKKINVKKYIHNFWSYNIRYVFDKSVRFEQGIYFDPKGFLYNFFLKKRIRNISILGCNFSCFKSDMIRINGFDESYGETAISDDMDFDWRFKAAGIRVKSCKNAANMFHLFHKAHDRGDPSMQLQRMQENQEAGRFVCEKGLNTH
jgi:glycosyltransferase involved in cell wall biosynthesis